jgi:hypothetical protein
VAAQGYGLGPIGLLVLSVGTNARAEQPLPSPVASKCTGKRPSADIETSTHACDGRTVL